MGGLYVESDMSRFSGSSRKSRPREGAAFDLINTSYISAPNKDHCLSVSVFLCRKKPNTRERMVLR